MWARVARNGHSSGWPSGALLAVLALMPTSAGAETANVHGTNQGAPVAPEQCDERDNFVQVTAYGRDVCIRYYVSEEGGSGRRPVVYLSGDHELPRPASGEAGGSFFGRFFNRAFGASRKQAAEPKAEEPDIKKIIGRVRDISRTTGTTAIFLSRMGIDGSSGSHRERRTMLELRVMNAALDALKRRHGYEGFQLVGQSGGSTLIGGILALRDDIGCAVPGSGRLARLRETRQPHDPALRRLDPSSMIPGIVRSRARILVVTDPSDQVVHREHQDTFIKDLEQAGGHIDQFYVRARDEKHHGVSTYAIFVTAGCMRGESYRQIARNLDEQVAEKIKARRKAKAQEKADEPGEAAR
jgi:hypothetical protein